MGRSDTYGVSGREKHIVRKKGAVILCLALVASLLISCKDGEKEETRYNIKEEKQLQIGLTFDTFVLERWIRDRDVLVSTADKYGVKVDVQNANGDVKKQILQIEKFIQEKMDVIVVVAVDCFALTDIVIEARNKGIDVISYDRLIQGTATDLYVTVDNSLVGKEMANTIMGELPDGGNVVMICGPEMDTNSSDVVDAFEDTVKNSNLTIVSKTYVQSWTPEYRFQAVNKAFKDIEKIDAVLCGNDGLAGYAIKALSEQQLAGQVVVVGQDADLDACQRVVEGTQTMTVYKPIEQLAKIAAECAVKFAKGQSVVGTDIKKDDVKKTESGIEVPYWGLSPTAVTKENMNQIIIEPGFHLQDEVYLNVENQISDYE